MARRWQHRRKPRRSRRSHQAADTAAELVRTQPGITTTDLRTAVGEAGITNNADKSSAAAKAAARGLLHAHRDARKMRHYPDPNTTRTNRAQPDPAHDAQPCPTLPNPARARSVTTLPNALYRRATSMTTQTAPTATLPKVLQMERLPPPSPLQHEPPVLYYSAGWVRPERARSC